MDTKCTCRSTPSERFLDRSCPIHGDAEMHRRHEPARRKPVEEMTDDEMEAEFSALFGRLEPATQAAIRSAMEGCRHE